MDNTNCEILKRVANLQRLNPNLSNSDACLLLGVSLDEFKMCQNKMVENPFEKIFNGSPFGGFGAEKKS